MYNKNKSKVQRYLFGNISRKMLAIVIVVMAIITAREWERLGA
jgi:hypothetical protein